MFKRFESCLPTFGKAVPAGEDWFDDFQYAEDLTLLPQQEEVEAALGRMWERPIRKQNALRIDGALLHGLERYKTHYRAKRENAVDPSAVSQAQGSLFGID